MKGKASFVCAAALAAVLCAHSPAPASGFSASGFSVGAQVGTLGVGVNAGYQLNDYLKFRANVNYLPYSRSQTISDVSYKADLKYFTIGALADAHPFANGFRLTGGLYYVDLSLKAKGKLEGSKSYTIGDHKYTGQDLGTWKGSLEWKTMAPYIGLGYGSGAGTDSGFNFSFDLGALYIGKSRVSLDPSSSAYEAAAQHGYDLHEDVQKEEDDVKRTVNKYRFYPVLSFGASYRF